MTEPTVSPHPHLEPKNKAASLSQRKQPYKKNAHKNNERKIIWAIDALQDEKDSQVHIVEALQPLADQAGAIVQPAYVMSPDQFNLSIEFSGPWSKAFKPAAEKSLHYQIKKSGLTSVSAPKVLIERAPSLKQAACTLSAYAASEGAEMIVTGSHGRQGWARLVLGSFAETLLLYSKVPVLVVGPHVHSGKAIKHILFASDLSPASEKAFSKVCDIALRLKAKITLFHAVPHPIEPVMQSGVYLLGGGWMPVPLYLENQKNNPEKKVEAFAAPAKKRGLKVQIKIEPEAASATQAILNASQEVRADWVAMAAESGPLQAALVGSITRQVVRASEIPVWVLRTA